jgi:hypothetical protein
MILAGRVKGQLPSWRIYSERPPDTNHRQKPLLSLALELRQALTRGARTAKEHQALKPITIRGTKGPTIASRLARARTRSKRNNRRCALSS